MIYYIYNNNEKVMDKYLKVGNTLVNHDFIKQISCNDDTCMLTIANTVHSSISITGKNHNSIRDIRYDKQYVYTTPSNEYNDLKSFFDQKEK